MKIIITEQQYSLLIKQNINEDFLDRYGEGVDNIVEVLGNLMNKMGVGRFIDKYGNFVEKVFGSISNFFKKLRGGDESINEQNTPEEWKEDIRTLERKFGNPSGWTMDEYYQMQQKLNDYKKWRETTPEGRAVVDMSNKPNEYVVPLPKHLKPVMESDLMRIVKRVIKENEKEYPPITLDLIKDYIMGSLSEYDISNSSTKRRIMNGVDKLSKHYYDMFIDRLVYLSEDDEWKEFLSDIKY